MATSKEKYRRLVEQAPILTKEGLTSYDIAARFNVSRSLVSRVLSGKGHPKWYRDEQDGKSVELE